MVKNNYNEPDKATLVAWVNEELNVALSKRNIKNGFNVTRIWPFNPKAMDERIKPSEFYAVITTMHQMRTMKKTLMKQLMILKVGVKME